VRSFSGKPEENRRIGDRAIFEEMQMQTLRLRLSISTAQRSGIGTFAISPSHRPDRSTSFDVGMACIDYSRNERQELNAWQAATPGRYCT
jgi:hypothetical protein